MNIVSTPSQHRVAEYWQDVNNCISLVTQIDDLAKWFYRRRDGKYLMITPKKPRGSKIPC